jgi:hypothetical protein
MTLIPHSPAELDRLALRLLDLAAEVRGMARRQREHELAAVPLHGNKIQEWLRRLEAWSHDAKSRADAEINKQIGARRAREFTAADSPRKRRRQKSK